MVPQPIMVCLVDWKKYDKRGNFVFSGEISLSTIFTGIIALLLFLYIDIHINHFILWFQDTFTTISPGNIQLFYI